MKKLLEKRADIVFFLKLTLIRQIPGQEQKSRAVVCSKSLDMLEQAFDGKTLPSADCSTRELENNTKFMEANGINSVPFILFPDGSVQSGFVESQVLEKMIDDAVSRMRAGSSIKKPEDGDGK